ncbi:LysM peptidoglycan-binding domain-containing protein [uncultured Kocuria sp.]|uniref:LysM peptidoglycan-binding domain-containing protein n=1 Tax=uncultured Kocuria sp. TaxID=259305 RepID=UPI002625414F|nr:LysM peptidoglycan-binding domain-containing protein [uncultured Kocuria sp.]
MSASATLSAVVARRRGSAGAAGGLGRAARRARPAGSRTPLTLTRRGRLVFLGLPVLAGSAALVVLAVIFLVPSTATATSEPVPGPGTEQTTVFPGQSLWEIAVTADPDRDPREVMDEIVELNDLDSSVLVAGRLLEVPAA